MVARPDLNGEDCHIFWHMAASAEDLLQNLKAAQLLAERSPLTGYASIGRDELHALMCATQDLDRARGTDYHRRVLDYVRRFQREQLMTAAAVTDVKGNRGLRPAQQDDPDMYLRIVDRNDKGIVVRGAKAHTSGSVGAEELIVIPTRAMRENEGQYAVAFAIPVDTAGITLVARALSAGSDSAWEAPIPSHDELAETFTVFNDVFVPHERVFLQGEWESAGDVANVFASVNRQGYLGTEVRQAADLHRRRAAHRRAQRRRPRRAHPREDRPADQDGALDLGARRRRLARKLQPRAGPEDPRPRADQRWQAPMHGKPLHRVPSAPRDRRRRGDDGAID